MPDSDHELRLLGRCLLSPDVALAVSSALSPEDFSVPVHRTLFEAIREIAASEKPNPTRILRWLIKHGHKEIDLSRYTEDACLPVEVETLVGVVKEGGMRRRLAVVATELAKAAENATDTDDLVTQAAQKAQEVFRLIGAGDAPLIQLSEAFADLWLSRDPEKRKYRRLAFGFPATLGHALKGLGAGRLHVLAGRPSMGKTSMALQWLVEACLHGGAQTVLIVSLEMSPEELADSILRQQTGQSLLVENAPGEELAKLSGLPIWISRKRGLRAQEIGVLARRLASERGGLDLVVVDHLQLIKIVTPRGENRANAVGDAVLALRDLAGDLECPLVLLSQLNRGVEGRDDKRPALSDLRESGNIEEHADVVLGLYREGYYKRSLTPDDPRYNMAEAIVMKNRGGPSGESFVLRFTPDRMLFSEVTPEAAEAYWQAVQRNGR